jgi:arylsulfatase A-like enzyme
LRKCSLGLRALLALAIFLLIPGRASSAVATRTGRFVDPANPVPLLAEHPRYVVMLVLDGALPSYFKLADFPHIAALQQQGVTYDSAWDGMLETETPTGHASLGTGTVPRRHGILSFSWVTQAGLHEQPTNPIPIQQGQLEQVLRRSGVPSIASELKKADPAATVAVTSGHKDYAVDAAGGPYADYLMYYEIQNQLWKPVAIPRHVPPQSVLSPQYLQAYAPHLAPGDQDYLAVQLALSSFRQVHQRVTIINLPEFDWPLGHLLGGPADKWFAWKLMTRLDTDIGMIEDTLRQNHVLKQTLFVLTADHGMLALNHRIPHELIARAVRKAGTSLDDYDYHSAGYFWLHNRRRAARVAANIVGLHNPYVRAVYYRAPGSLEYVRALGGEPLASPAVATAYQFLLGTLVSPSAPQVVMFLAENTSIVGRNETNWRGDHGGASWNAEHIPLILSGPGVRQGIHSAFPATIYDIAPTILALLQAPWTGMDGMPLYDALTAPDVAGADAQAARGARWEPFVQALRLQSRQDGP